MVTDKAGTVYPGYITADMISPDYLAGGEEAITGALKADRYGSVSWGLVSDLIGSGMLRAGMIKTEIGTNNTGVLINSKSGLATWGKIRASNIETGAVTADKIASGAVTREKTDGIIGTIPIGGKDSTVYGAFWIE